MTQTTLGTDAELKARHRAMWALGDYPSVAAELVADLGAVLVRAANVSADQRVLDVATGSGNAAIPAARTGAEVTATDLTPELLDAGRRDAEARGVHVTWAEADAEVLPYGDGEFDVVLSCLGVMFAPHHERAASEVARVCRRGGTIALLNWTRGGFVGELFETMKQYAPPPPGTQPPLLWGDEEHVRALFRDAVSGVWASRRALTVNRFATPEQFRDYFKSKYGPTVAAYRALAGSPTRVAALDADLVQLARRHMDDSGAMGWEYLLLTARRA